MLHKHTLRARVGSTQRPQRRTVVSVCNVFSLSRAVGSMVNSTKASVSSKQSAAAATLEAPNSSTATSNLHPRKAVQGVPVKDRATVELIMALTSLGSKPTDSLANRLAEHELNLVTTSATCDSMFASVLDSMSEDYATSGDGMASPLADIRAAAEQLAAEVRGSTFASEWNPSTSPRGSSFAPPPSSSHALEQLMAQAEYDALNNSNSTGSKEANSVMARVQALQQQIKAAATKAAAASSMPRSKTPSGSGSSSSSSGAGSSAANTRKTGQSSGAGSAGAASSAGAATNKSQGGVLAHEPTLQRSQPPSTASFDEDCCGDAAAMPVIPGVFGSSASAAAGLPFGRAVSSAIKAANQPSYPVYKDPASSWLVADAADGRTRMIVIQAPKELAAAVAGARASSDLTTFETYNLGAKINKALYNEANALYNRFMPLLLDHLEEAGPSGRIMLCGSGLGGSLSALLLLMFVARGMRPSAFAPVYTLNAPAVLCEVPDFKQWCSKDGCSLQDMDGMLEDLLHRGILSQLGLSQDAVRNIYHNQGAAEAAVQAVHSKLGPLQAVAASGSKQFSSMVQHLDVAALQASPYVPDVLKAWLKAEGSGAHAEMQRLHILNPVGKMMLYVASSGTGAAASSVSAAAAAAAGNYSRFTGNGTGSLSTAYSNGKH